ncbi:glycosyltransferase family 2 protein [Ensifer sp. YR511]|uniref:glycosyltransferase family 2 protein n=1 Tax=Ensifer sp. YR511 TaxID=1855294 RepID=UPI000B7D5C76
MMASNRCAVVIPTKNAMARLPRVIAKVLKQQTPWPYEIIVIDSGSNDGTREYLRTVAQVRLIEIEPHEFGHGKTRNLGVSAADADLVAFLTHDAEPLNEFWLTELVDALEQDPRIAGVFGRHIAYECATPFVKMDLDRHFQGFLNYPLVVHRDLDPIRYKSDERWRQLLHFYSDNNSLMRKSVWEAIPYPDVEFAEDQLWAREIIEAGYFKAYAPDAIVCHSHDYAFLEQLKRAYDESRNFKKYFGYKLSSRPVHAAASIVGLVNEAFRQEVDGRFGEVTFAHRVRRAMQRVALISGHFLGANYERLPGPISTWLSLDTRLFRA